MFSRLLNETRICFWTLAIFSFLLSGLFFILAVMLNFSDCTGMKIEGCYYDLYLYSLFLRSAFVSGIIFSGLALLIRKQKKLK